MIVGFGLGRLFALGKFPAGPRNFHISDEISKFPTYLGKYETHISGIFPAFLPQKNEKVQNDPRK